MIRFLSGKCVGNNVILVYAKPKLVHMAASLERH